MAKGFNAVVETAALVQNTLTEVLASTIYGNIPIDVVRVLEEFGVFGDQTPGTYYSFLNDETIVANQSQVNATDITNKRDAVSTTKHPGKPGSQFRLYIFATAAAPGRYKIWLKGKDFNLDELIGE